MPVTTKVIKKTTRQTKTRVFETVRRIVILSVGVCRRRWRAGDSADETEWGKKEDEGRDANRLEADGT